MIETCRWDFHAYTLNSINEMLRMIINVGSLQSDGHRKLYQLHLMLEMAKMQLMNCQCPNWSHQNCKSLEIHKVAEYHPDT